MPVNLLGGSMPPDPRDAEIARLRKLLEEASALLTGAPLVAHDPLPAGEAFCGTCEWQNRMQAWHDKWEALPA